MAIRFTANQGQMYRTTNLPNPNAAHTVMAWIRQAVDTNTNVLFLAHHDGAGLSVEAVGTHPDGTTSTLAVSTGGVALGGSGPSIGGGGWIHVARVRESASMVRLYINGVEVLSDNRSMTSRSGFNRFDVSGIALGGTLYYPLDGSVAHIKMWNAALTAAEVQAEMDYVVPVRTSNIHAWYPTKLDATRYQDYGPNAYHFTTSGTLTEEAGPVIAYEPVAAQTYDETGVATTLYVSQSGTDTLQKVYVETSATQTIAVHQLGIDTTSSLFDETGGLVFRDAVFEGIDQLYQMEMDAPYTIGAAFSGFDVLDTQSEGLLLLGVTVHADEQNTMLDERPVNVWLRGSGVDNFIPGPTVLNYTIQFTVQDNTSTVIAYEVWTGPSATGTLLLEGEAESGVAHTSDTITDAELVHGENTRYLRIYDVQGNWSEYPFIVDAMLGETYEDLLGQQVIANMTAGMDSVIFVDTGQILGVTAPISGEITHHMQEVVNLQTIAVSLDGTLSQTMAEMTGAVTLETIISGIFGSIWNDTQDVLQIAAFVDASALTEYWETDEGFEIVTNFDGLDVVISTEYADMLIDAVVSGIDFDPGDASSALILVYTKQSGFDTLQVNEPEQVQEIEVTLDADESESWVDLLSEVLAEAEVYGTDVHAMVEVEDQLVLHAEVDGVDSDVWFHVLDTVLQAVETGGLDTLTAYDLNPYQIHVEIGGMDSPAVSEMTGLVDILVRIEGEDRIPLRLYLRFDDHMLVQIQPYDGDILPAVSYDTLVMQETPYDGDIELVA